MFRHSCPWLEDKPRAVAEQECVRLAFAEAKRQGVTLNTYRLEFDPYSCEFKFAAEPIR